MKFKLFTVLFVEVAFGICEASNINYLSKYMQNKLSSPPPPLPPWPTQPRVQSPVGNVSMSGIPAHEPPNLLRLPICPREVNTSWQLRPPFTLEENDTSNEDQPTYGIFHRALDLALKKCCEFYRGNKTIMRYLSMYENSTELHDKIFSNDTGLVFPVQDNWFTGAKRRYIHVLDSPGVVLIRRETSYSTDRSGQLFKAVLGTWPIVVMSILMSSLAGICIWMLDTSKNANEFGRPFYRGAFDGFWWAFVTMSTVGYGDKTPKSISGRLFAVVWIMIGITVCSILTATLSSALTSITVETYHLTTGKTIGAPKASFAFKRAVNLGASVTDYENLQEAYYSLENEKVEGILEEMFAGMMFVENKSNSGLSVARVFEERHGYGAVINEDGFSEDVLECLPKVMEFASDEIYSNITRLRKSVKHSDNLPSVENLEHDEALTKDVDYNIFDPDSISFKATVLGISVALLVLTTCSVGFAGIRHLRQKRQRKKRKSPVDLEAGCLELKRQASATSSQMI